MSLVQLRREDPAENMLRFYSLHVRQTPFGGWELVREFGRVIVDAFGSLDEAATAHTKLWQTKMRDGYYRAGG